MAENVSSPIILPPLPDDGRMDCGHDTDDWSPSGGYCVPCKLGREPLAAVRETMDEYERLSAALSVCRNCGLPIRRSATYHPLWEHTSLAWPRAGDAMTSISCSVFWPWIDWDWCPRGAIATPSQAFGERP